jgi:hypothetical protein
MRFHLIMLLVVIFVAFSMHAMANAADAPHSAPAPLSSPDVGAH